jgi:DNA polymerase III subunit delta
MPKEQVKPIYVLFGDDEYLLDVRRKEIVAQAIGDGDAQLCISSFDGDAELANVLDELRTLPFLAPHRVVIVSQADAFITAHRDAIEKYLETPAATGTLILQAGSWPSNTRLYKVVAKAGLAINCSADRENLSKWIVDAAKQRGKTVTDDASDLLAQWIGRDLAALDSEIEKLCIFVGDRSDVQEKDVAALVTATAGPEAYALTNCITAGDAAGALKALSGMLTKRGEEFKVLGMIGWHLRKALQALQALKSGQNEFAALGKMPYDQKRVFMEMLRRRGTGKLLNDFRRMLRADLAMKSGADATAAMQDLVIALCR